MLKFSLSSCIRLPSLLSILMTISLNSLSGKLLIFISLGGFFKGFILFFHLEHIFVSLFCLTFVYFYKLGERAMPPGLEGMTLCGSVLSVNCLYLAALADQLELKWVQFEGSPWGALCWRPPWWGGWGWTEHRLGSVPGECGSWGLVHLLLDLILGFWCFLVLV